MTGARIDDPGSVRANSSLPAIIVGAGLMGRWHAHAVAHSGGTVMAVVDQDLTRATNLARRYAGAAAFGDVESALATGASGVVHLCTPLSTHGPLALAALRARAHVLVEKPLAEDLRSARELLDTAKSVGRLICPVHQFLFQPGALLAASLLPSLGSLRHLEAEVCSTGAEHSLASADEVALEILPHALALAARFCPGLITEAEWSYRTPSPGELVVGASVGEVNVTARISTRGRPPVNALRLVTEGGTIHLDLFHGFALVDRTNASRTMKIARPAFFAARLATAAVTNLAGRVIRQEPAYPGLRELVRRFYVAAATGGPSPIPDEETRAVADVWSALRARVLTGAS